MTAYYCPHCKGVLYQKWDFNYNRRIYYEMTLRCMLCGRDWDKVYLNSRLNLNLNSKRGSK